MNVFLCGGGGVGCGSGVYYSRLYETNIDIFTIIDRPSEYIIFEEMKK